MKEEICRAFCDGLTLTEVPSGLAVGTAFRRPDGDAIGFYIVGPDAGGLYRIEDDGLTVADLEVQGADLEIATRAQAFEALLTEYGAKYEEASGALTSGWMPQSELARAAMRFVALLLRLQDLQLLTPERATSTFREEAKRAIREAVDGKATIEEDIAVHPSLDEFPADVVVRSPNRPPVAVFLAMTDIRAYEAIMLQMAAMYEAHVQCSVIALLEREASLSRKMRQRAANRLTATPIFEGDEVASIMRIAREAVGEMQSIQ